MRFVLAILAIVLPSVASSAPVLYECVITKGLQKSPFTERILIEIGEDQKSARVDDAYIRHFEGKPIAAKLGEMSEKKSVVNWTVHASNRSGQTTRLAFRAAILSNGNVVLTAKPHGYSNVFNARGRCRQTNAKMQAS